MELSLELITRTLQNVVNDKRFTVPAVLTILSVLHRLVQRRKRRKLKNERVLIIGGGSGIGRDLALEYGKQGAHVWITGRRLEKLQEVAKDSGNTFVVPIQADFTNVEDMLRVRDILTEGLDTLIIVAGVSALQPVLALAGVHQIPTGKGSVKFVPEQSRLEGVTNAMSIAQKAYEGNFVGPFLSALVFIPFLSSTSSSPNITLISSAAGLIPAPTRALYCSSKSSGLVFFQSLRIEHPHIHFLNIIPGTVTGDFRAGAVDGGIKSYVPPSTTSKEDDGLSLKTSPVRESLVGALSPSAVAKRTIRAIENREHEVWMPFMMRLAHWLYWLPGVLPRLYVERGARKKYRYP